MTPYYEGTTEAEHLIRCSPELVELWLNKARRDRGRLMTRLFQKQRCEFLDGFIAGLAGHLARAAAPNDRMRLSDETPAETRTVRSPIVPLKVTENERNVENPARDSQPGVVDSGVAVDSESVVVEIEAEGAAAVPPISPATVPVHAVAQAGVDGIVSVELTERVPTGDDLMEPSEPHSTLEVANAAAGSHEYEADIDRALGVVKLSGWTVDADPQELPHDGETHLVATQEPRSPETPVNWVEVFEQARGGSIVDVSAYDFLDGLGELRELIDHWQHLNQNPANGEVS